MTVNHICGRCDTLLKTVEDVANHVCPADPIDDILIDDDGRLDQLVEAQQLTLADLFKTAKDKGYITPSSHYEGAPAP